MSLKRYVFDATNMIMQCRYHLAKANVNVFPFPSKATFGRVFAVVKNNAFVDIGPNINFDMPIKQIENALINIKHLDENTYNALLEMDTTQLMFENMLQKINKTDEDAYYSLLKVDTAKN